MTVSYGPPIDDEDGILAIGKALELGINFLDTAWIYQDIKTGNKNEVLVGKALQRYGREKFVVATKFGLRPDATGNVCMDSSKELMRKQLEQSLENLQTTYIDLYYQHRTDPNVPIEQVIEALKEFVQEGKVKYIGLSECTPDELRRAHAVHPITAIQMEWSLQTRDIEKDIVPIARELGVAIVAYSPLGRGLLSQRVTTSTQLEDGDFRKNHPRFTADNLIKNAEAASRLELIAQEKGLTGGQLALAWLHHQGHDVFPIPGTRSAHRIVENSGALRAVLSKDDQQRVEEAVPEAQGNRALHMASTYHNRM